ncbi:MAG: PadR family transcriptional regulator [Chloroflexota bacterium]|nr:PadR family transcriptional regulator [Chloroflexota bacterium]
MSGYTVNATGGSLLGFLHERPMTGWDLVTVAQQRIGNFWSLTQSQVYRELNAMAQAGLVEAGERGSRDRQPFAITDAGRAAFSDWVLQGPGKEVIRFPLLITIMFGEHVPTERLAEIVASHEKMHAERLANFRAIEASIPESSRPLDPYSLATLHFGIRYEEAVLEWFRELPEGIRGDATAIEATAQDSGPEGA